MAGAAAPTFVERKIAQRTVMLFSKTYCPLSKRVKEILAPYVSQFRPGAYEVVEIEKRQDVNEIEDYFQIICYPAQRPCPALFVNGVYLGTYDEVLRLHLAYKLRKIFIDAQAWKIPRCRQRKSVKQQ